MNPIAAVRIESDEKIRAADPKLIAAPRDRLDRDRDKGFPNRLAGLQVEAPNPVGPASRKDSVAMNDRRGLNAKTAGPETPKFLAASPVERVEIVIVGAEHE